MKKINSHLLVKLSGLEIVIWKSQAPMLAAINIEINNIPMMIFLFCRTLNEDFSKSSFLSPTGSSLVSPTNVKVTMINYVFLLEANHS